MLQGPDRSAFVTRDVEWKSVINRLLCIDGLLLDSIVKIYPFEVRIKNDFVFKFADIPNVSTFMDSE